MRSDVLLLLVFSIKNIKFELLYTYNTNENPIVSVISQLYLNNILKPFVLNLIYCVVFCVSSAVVCNSRQSTDGPEAPKVADLLLITTFSHYFWLGFSIVCLLQDS